EEWPLGPIPSVELEHAPEPDEDEPDAADPAVLREMPGLASWSELHLYKLDSPEEHARLCVLLRSPHLTNLTGLSAVRSAVYGAAIDALAEAPAGFRLRRLSLDSCGLRGRDLRRLARDPAFAGLSELTLCESVPEAALGRLLASSNLANLRRLFLGS